VLDDIDRARGSVESLMKAMQKSGVELLTIKGMAEMKRGLKGISKFGENGHDALREINHPAEKKAVPDRSEVSPKPRRSVGEDAKQPKRKKATNHD
jgi:hypothetical protein